MGSVSYYFVLVIKRARDCLNTPTHRSTFAALFPRSLVLFCFPLFLFLSRLINCLISSILTVFIRHGGWCCLFGLPQSFFPAGLV